MAEAGAGKSRGRHLDSTGAESLSFLIPLVIWGVLATTAFGVSYNKLQAALGPISDTNAAGLLGTMATQVQLSALQLIVQAGRGVAPAALAAQQAALAAGAGSLLNEYTAIVNGARSAAPRGGAQAVCTQRRSHCVLRRQATPLWASRGRSTGRPLGTRYFSARAACAQTRPDAIHPAVHSIRAPTTDWTDCCATS